MEYDLHHNVNVLSAIDAAEFVANGTVVGNIIDTKEYGSIEFVGQLGTVTDGDFDLVLEDGDDSGLSDAAAVDSDLVLGGLFNLDASDDVKRAGCITKKRYIRASLVGTGITSGVDSASMIAVLSHAKRMPIADSVA